MLQKYCSSVNSQKHEFNSTYEIHRDFPRLKTAIGFSTIQKIHKHHTEQKHSPGLPHPSISMVPFCRPSRAHLTDQTNVPYRNANANSISSMRRATLMFQNEHMLFVVGRAFFPGTTLRRKHLKSHKTSHMFAKTPPNRLKKFGPGFANFSLSLYTPGDKTNQVSHQSSYVHPFHALPF